MLVHFTLLTLVNLVTTVINEELSGVAKAEKIKDVLESTINESAMAFDVLRSRFEGIWWAKLYQYPLSTNHVHLLLKLV